MGTPRMAPAEAHAQALFTTLMWALSYPGRAQELPVRGADPFVAIAETLVDLETSYYTDDPALRSTLARTGGRLRPVAEAMYHFYPKLSSAAAASLAAAAIGTYPYPDESATLVIGCTFGNGQQLRLRGPGIATSLDVQVSGMPGAFWPLRAQACRFPLGWDVFLVAAGQVVGVPRTTTIEVL